MRRSIFGGKALTLVELTCEWFGFRSWNATTDSSPAGRPSLRQCV